MFKENKNNFLTAVLVMVSVVVWFIFQFFPEFPMK